MDGDQRTRSTAWQCLVRRREAWLFIASACIALSCRPCRGLGPAVYDKDAYWPSRGLQRSAECHPERGPYRCSFYQPRCDKSDPHCGPLPMGKYDSCYDPAATRKPIDAAYAGPSCQFDGECLVDSGCTANYCVHYRSYPVGEDVCQFSAVDWNAYDNVLCGCVSNQCRPFKL